MKRAQQPGTLSRNGAPQKRCCETAVGLLLTLAVAYAAPGDAQTLDATIRSPAPIDETLKDTDKGHGSISIGYQSTLADGLKVNHETTLPSGSVRSRGIHLDLDYNFADNWSAHFGVPFISNRYNGGAPHCPTNVPMQCQHAPVLSHQHPESQFLDDGNFHSTWQDWAFGVAYHTNMGNYLITPSITAYIPTHDYTFFANAAVGQDLWKLEFAVSLAHQFDFSNLYYRVGYGYVLAEQTLGASINHSRLNLELGYFVNEKLSVRLFGIGKVGDGFSAGELIPLTNGQTNDYWYHHDQISEHNYFGVGVGFDYALGDRYTVSASVQKLVWGQSVFDFKYAAEARLTRAF